MNLETPPPQDALPNHWVARMPADLQPFLRLMRLDRPIGIWLLVIPCYWGAALASVADQKILPNIWHLVLFTLGAILMRGAGCVWNDTLDRDIDARVARTINRPLAAGLLNPREALLFMTILMLSGFVILLQFNAFTIIMGIISVALIAIYPSIKRVSDFPQIILGLAFSWGVLLGWTAYFGSLSMAPVMLYAAAIAWTIGYDTIYALQDVEDDELLSIGSTARRFGSSAKVFVAACYSFTILIAAAAFYLASAKIMAYLGLVVFASLLVYQLLKLDIKDPASALKSFKMNKIAGLMLFAGLVLDGIVRFS